MKIDYLKLYQYRNYKTLELTPHERLTVFVGNNAQGKTNILEAIYLFATGRSHRTAKESQLIAWDQDIAYARLDLTEKNKQDKIEIRLLRNRGKQIKINNSPISRIGELMGCLNVVMFSPEDLRLVKDGPSERRRFMDIELSQMNRSYFYALSQYLHAMSQRNALLKTLQFHPERAAQLDVWDEQMSQHGSVVYAFRTSFIQDLSEIVQRIHADLSAQAEHLTLTYHSDLPANLSKEQVQENILQQLLAQRNDDIKKGLTQKGIHRDDMIIKLNQMDMRAYASQGQQRTAALALKIAELHLMEKTVDRKPIFLLDDVLSELDSQRQHLLLEASSSFQTLLTTTFWNESSADYDVYHVEEGKIALLEKISKK